MLQPLRSNQPRKRVAIGASVPAPVEGWDAISPLADMPEERAIVLDNWFPHIGSVEVRKGYRVHGVDMGSSPVETLIVHNALTAATTKLLAVTAGKIWNVSSSGPAVVSSVTGLTNNRWQYVNYTTSAGTHYTWMCNGVDTPYHYDGTTFTAPTITGVTAANIVHVNVHKKRIWGILIDSMDACYLPLDSVAGAATKFPLGSVLQKGGYLVAMATWTRDGGAGPDDLAVFISSLGQVAIYQGTNPASDFVLVGVFDLGPPLGRRCFTKVAGDVAVVTWDGVVPLSKALLTDRGAEATIAITKNINHAINTAVSLYSGNFGWELTPYSKGSMALLNVPISAGSNQHQYVMNTLSGAWCRFTGWNFNTFAVYKDNLYGGGNDGVVYQADHGALDLTTVIEATGQTAYNYFKTPGQIKKFGGLRPIITTDSSSKPSIGLSTDFRDNATIGTPTSAATQQALYDAAVYDTDVYPVEGNTIADWTTVSGIGHAASIHFKARIGQETALSLWGYAEWGNDAWSGSISGEVFVALNAFQITMEKGEFL